MLTNLGDSLNFGDHPESPRATVCSTTGDALLSTNPINSRLVGKPDLKGLRQACPICPVETTYEF